jgi:predicted amidophosphoribosyltransferase
MEDKINISNSMLFTEYANNNIDIWKLSLGKLVKHINLGEGKILEVEQMGESLYIKIFFPSQPKNDSIKLFTVNSMASNFFCDMDIPSELNDILEFKEKLEKRIRNKVALEIEERGQKEIIRLKNEARQEELRKQQLLAQQEIKKHQLLAQEKAEREYRKEEAARKKYNLNGTVLKDISTSYPNLFAACHLAYYFTSYSGETDKISSDLLKFKNNNQEYTQIWSELAAQELSKVLNIDYIIRALGSNEIVSNGKSSLDYLCYSVAQKCNAYYAHNILTKSRPTAELKYLKKQERIAELRDVYKFKAENIKDGSYILIVDDILTSASTMYAIYDAITEKLPDAKILFFSLGKTHSVSWDGEVDNIELLRYIQVNKQTLLRNSDITKSKFNTKEVSHVTNIKYNAGRYPTEEVKIDEKVSEIKGKWDSDKTTIKKGGQEEVHKINVTYYETSSENKDIQQDTSMNYKKEEVSIVSRVLKFIKRIFN